VVSYPEEGSSIMSFMGVPTEYSVPFPSFYICEDIKHAPT